MSLRLDQMVLLLACLVTACGGRSSLGDSGATNEAGGALHGASSGGTWGSTGSNMMIHTGGAMSAQGGFIASTGGAPATGGSPAGQGGTKATGGTTPVGNGGSANATGGVTHATGGVSTTGGTRATGGATLGQGGTKATGGTSLGQGGMSVSSGGSGNQGGVNASGGTSVVTGGMTATGGLTGAATGAGGTAGSNTIGECGVDQVMCAAGAAAKCVDTLTDPENCGNCGFTCAKRAACSSGTCVLPRCQSTFRMGSVPTIETDNAATDLAVGDFNGDGHLDFATANSTANTVSVLLGDGKGAFGQRSDHPTGKNPGAIAIGDFNHDGKQDLVTANLDDDSVSVLLGKGDGAFESAVQYPVGDWPWGIAIDDFDGDGSEDIATANSSADSVSILLGSGHGTFATKVDYAAGTGPSEIVTGDFNEDGKKDLITNGGPATAIVLLGVGNGTFLAASKVPTDANGDRVYSLALGDLNGDKKQDLIVGSANGRYSPGVFGVLFGVGDGSFLPKVDYNVGSARVVASTDLDGDGKLELVASVWQQSLSVLTLNADGSLAGAVSYPTPAPAGQVVFGDFNGDHWLDIATLDRWGIYLLMATGNGKFDAPVGQPTGASLRNLLLRDLNGDGQLDIAGIARDIDAGTANINVQLGLGDGTFVGRNEHAIRFTDGLIEAGDLNGDGHPDLVTADDNESGVSVLWNAGDASYPSRTDYATTAGTDFLGLGDLDNNGKLDILVASVDSSLQTSAVTVLLNQGSGYFTSAVYDYAEVWNTVALADLNHDDRVDLVQSNGAPGGLTVQLGVGDGTFGTRLQLATNDASIIAYSVVLGDLNGDGNLDLVSLDNRTPYIDVMLGVGDGTFTPLSPQAVVENYGLRRFALGDLNGDGILDLLSNGNISWVGYEIVVLLGAGDGTFTCTTASLPAGAEGEVSAWGDVNGDKRLDLVVPNTDAKSVTVLLNQPL